MPKAMIIYETRTGNTKLIADTILQGLKLSGIEALIKKIDEVDIAELADYDCVILGAPTYHKDIIPTMKTFLFKLEQAKLKGKVGAAFGAWGWSGESVEMISDTMKHIYGMKVHEPEAKMPGAAKGITQSQYRAFGRDIAEKIKKTKK